MIIISGHISANYSWNVPPCKFWWLMELRQI